MCIHSTVNERFEGDDQRFDTQEISMEKHTFLFIQDVSMAIVNPQHNIHTKTCSIQLHSCFRRFDKKDWYFSVSQIFFFFICLSCCYHFRRIWVFSKIVTHFFWTRKFGFYFFHSILLFIYKKFIERISFQRMSKWSKHVCVCVC